MFRARRESDSEQNIVIVNNDHHHRQGSATTTTRFSASSSSSSSSSTPSHTPSHTRTRKPKPKPKTKPKTKPKMPPSPRTAAYELLESGTGTGTAPHARRRGLGLGFAWTWTWKKFVLGAVVFVGLVWVVGPRRNGNGGYSNGGGGVLEHETYPSAPSPPTPPTPALTFTTDPDPSLTTHCTHPHTLGTPLVQYALIIDAGSTGSRIHIYKFNNCLRAPTFEYEVFAQTQPGLSAFAADPAGAAQSLDVLMAEAVRVVPRGMWGCTPVAVKATAGLRLLPDAQVAGILRAVEERLTGRWGAVLAGGPGEAVGVMDGREEGVYAWITANYLMGRMDGAATYAVLDLGGASTQIAFEPEPRGGGVVMDEGDHRFELAMAGRTHVLYQHSYLGYGLMRARAQVHGLVGFMAHMRGAANDSVVGNPCLAKGTQRVVELDARNVSMVGDDIGSFDACYRVVELVMAKDAICKLKPCAFNGVYQPSLIDAFPTGPVLLLSYFYDRLSPLLPPPSPPPADPDAPLPLTPRTIAALARTICAGRSAWLAAWGAQPALMADLAGRPEYCLDLTFMYALLRRGYEFAEEREVSVAKRVRGTELGWCLGAALEVVAGDLRCTDGE